MITRLRGLALAALTAIGCSDATGPASSTARHIDALYQQACAQARKDAAYEVRCEVLATLLVAPASGAEPTTLQVMTSGTTSTDWRGVVVAFSDTGEGFATGPRYALMAYSDADVTTAIIAEIVAGSETGPYILTDTVATNASAFDGPLVDLVSTEGKCIDTPGLANPLADATGLPPIEYSGSVCRVGTFSVSLTASFPVPGADSGLASVTIPQQNVSGILVTNPPDGTYFQRTR